MQGYLEPRRCKIKQCLINKHFFHAYQWEKKSIGYIPSFSCFVDCCVSLELFSKMSGEEDLEASSHTHILEHSCFCAKGPLTSSQWVQEEPSSDEFWLFSCLVLHRDRQAAAGKPGFTSYTFYILFYYWRHNYWTFLVKFCSFSTVLQMS